MNKALLGGGGPKICLFYYYLEKSQTSIVQNSCRHQGKTKLIVNWSFLNCPLFLNVLFYTFNHAYVTPDFFVGVDPDVYSIDIVQMMLCNLNYL